VIVTVLLILVLAVTASAHFDSIRVPLGGYGPGLDWADTARTFDPWPARPRLPLPDTLGAQSFHVRFAYGPYAQDIIDTFAGWFIYGDACPAETIRVVLSHAEKDSIYRVMRQVEFFEAPDRVKVRLHRDQRIVAEQTPYESWSLSVRLDGTDTIVKGDDRYVIRDDTERDRAREVFRTIKRIVRRHPEIPWLKVPCHPAN
jgi:hypothetical protein